MSSFDISCSNCKKRFHVQTENNEQIRYCPFCAKSINTEPHNTSDDPAAQRDQTKPIKMVLPPRPGKKTSPDTAQSKPEENRTAAQSTAQQKTVPAADTNKSVKFINEKNEYCCDGWIPDGYKPLAKLEPNGNPDVPVVVWAFAKNNNGKEMFTRIRKLYSFPKSKITEQNRFREFDEYLDHNAAEILKTNNLRLVRRFPISSAEEEELRNLLIKKREDYYKIYNSSFLKCVIQGLYAAKGGKLYEGDVNGVKKYALLYTTIIASEYGTYSPMNNRMQAQNDQLLNSIMGMVGGRSGGLFGGISSPNQYNQPQMNNNPVQFDTDPRTPIGRHRTDGLSSAVMSWQIFYFSGFVSPTMPTDREISDFFRFRDSVRICQPLSRSIEQLQTAIVNQNIMTQQAITNSIQQATRSQQASFERSQAAIKSLGEFRDQLMQQRIADDNARFDRSVRRNHEAIMGVNTYTRTDGTNVEVSVAADRAFQRENNPNLVIDAPSGADVPFGWTELEKLQ